MERNNDCFQFGAVSCIILQVDHIAICVVHIAICIVHMYLLYCHMYCPYYHMHCHRYCIAICIAPCCTELRRKSILLYAQEYKYALVLF